MTDIPVVMATEVSYTSGNYMKEPLIKPDMERSIYNDNSSSNYNYNNNDDDDDDCCALLCCCCYCLFCMDSR